jgi:predicted ATPase/DNA-binding SARP family transcriptional activator
VSEGSLWRISLLGGFRVACGANAVAGDAWRKRKAAALIKLLALAHGHRLHREQLMETLWPDRAPAAAANGLYQAIHYARRAFETVDDGGSRCLQFDQEVLCLCPNAPLWIDADAFDAAAHAALGSPDLAAHQAALALYAGELLPEDLYEDWAGPRRTALRLAYLSLLTDLAGLQEAREEHLEAIATLQRVVAADPAHEPAHCSLMRLYCMTGDRRQALRQYQTLREALERELDAEPDAASQALYREIATGRGAGCISREAAELQSAALHGGPAVTTSPRQYLPLYLTSFVGREHEKIELVRLLSTARLVTLTGPGGCGKTRLAVAVAADLLPTYPAGAWWVDLSALAEPALVARAAASALQAPETAGRTATEAAAGAIGDKRLLLVLDNCEHLVEACAELARALLIACPNLTVLATSRERLDVPGEVAWPVPALSLPDRGRLPPLPALLNSPAVRLFCDRAASVRPAFALAPENARAVADICVHLDGIPLAIELAAARVRLLAPDQIAAGLEDRFGLLTGGDRSSLPRQRTLRGAMDWSYDLLSEPERVLLRRLAVFRGGFSLEAVETVCEGSLDLLARLVDKSLVQVEVYGAQARYALLETIQRYSAEKLASAGETAKMQDRHLLFYLGLAEGAEPWLKTGERAPWMDLLDCEIGNFRAALAWGGQGQGEPGGRPAEAISESERRVAGLRLAVALGFYWELRGHFRERMEWLTPMLAGMPAGPDDALPRARAMTVVGSASAWLPVGQELLVESVALARALGPPARPALAEALRELAPWVRDEQAARRYIEESLGLARAEEKAWEIARGLQAYGEVCYSVGDVAGAYRYYTESLEAFRKLGDQQFASVVLVKFGQLEARQGDYTLARRHLEECVELERQIGDKLSLAFALGYLGEVAFAQSEYDEDAGLLDESIALFRDLGWVGAFASCMYHRGMVAERLGDYESSARLLRESMLHLRDADYADGMLGCLVGFACLALAQGHEGRAASLLGAVTELMQSTGVDLHDHLAARMAYERAMEGARPAMDQPEWAIAWAAGRAMSLAESVEFALGL